MGATFPDGLAMLASLLTVVVALRRLRRVEQECTLLRAMRSPRRQDRGPRAATRNPEQQTFGILDPELVDSVN